MQQKTLVDVESNEAQPIRELCRSIMYCATKPTFHSPIAGERTTSGEKLEEEVT